MKLNRVLIAAGLAAGLLACEKPDHQFERVGASATGINFTNTLKEDTAFNIIEYLYFYNGGGVAAGDINNDGLVDLYFSSNQQPNRLYLNRGDWKFEDITDKAGVQGLGNWKTGVTMADVNGDGWLDLYASGVGGYKNYASQNQLLINNGNLTFSDRTAEYGLSFRGLATQAAFFDYDLDGDLDCYLLNHSVHSTRAYVKVSERQVSDSLGGDMLLRNDLISGGKNTGVTHFTNITREAGILSSRLGYGLGIAVSDVNLDGWPDLYVSNDFQENDYLYLNDHHGHFRQVLEQSVAHSSRFSMGNDIADFNNDGRPDIITLDMLPRDESVIKTSAGEDAYEVYKFKLRYGYHTQVARNCLQVNVQATDTSVLFSDVAPLAGVEATDWSWSPLFADWDNDGRKDLLITNGIFRRPNDMDYINFISNQEIQSSLQKVNRRDLSLLEKMPAGKVSNFVFRNEGDLRFSDQTAAWGLDLASFSNGSAFADLDNDGDLDVIINNINEPATLYRNSAANRGNHWLTLSLQGGEANRYGTGVRAMVWAGGQMQTVESAPSRGFSSSSDNRLFVGLGAATQADSVVVIWPGGASQRLTQVKADQTLVVKITEATTPFDYARFRTGKPLLTPVAKSRVPDFVHQENDFNAFNVETLIPHALTNEGPPLAVADINGDGLDDVFAGGARGQAGQLFLQQPNGSWKSIANSSLEADRESEDVSATFTDVNNDGHPDLIVLSGGQESPDTPALLAPRLYLNVDGRELVRAPNAFPKIYFNGACVRPYDYDGDGDQDLFFGSSLMPLLYGMSPMSYLLVNDGTGHFQADHGWLGDSMFDNPTRVRPGMIKDAVWADVNNDRQPDLILVGEWMAVTVLVQQRDHRFTNETSRYGLDKTRGWWNTIVTLDADGDGDMDLVAGNYGLNSRLRASVAQPVKMYLGDFDSNGSSDHIIVYYNGDKSYPFTSRDQLVKQLPGLKKKFLHYTDYRDVNLEDIITPQQQGNSALMQAEQFASVWLRNDGDKFTVIELPREAQVAPVKAILAEDVNGDGHTDLLLTGNLTATQPELGPADASTGLLLAGDGKGHWRALTADESGFVVPGEGRAIGVVHTSDRRRIFLVSRNNQSLVGFTPR